MIEVFKITHNIYDPEVSPELRYYPKSRGNKYKLLNHTFHYDTRKYSFSARIDNIWNSLPNFVVDVDTVCLFKVLDAPSLNISCTFHYIPRTA